jgi:hypothetical protein
MARATRNEALPEARHPFARWAAGLSVSCWALAVQSFPEPWNKIGALVSVGAGYVVGQGLDYVAAELSARRAKKKALRLDAERKGNVERVIAENQQKIDYPDQTKTRRRFVWIRSGIYRLD